MSSMVLSSPEATHSHERQQLLASLLEAVKECQVRFGGRAELATETDSRVVELCNCLEEVLSHGLRQKPLTKNNSTFRQMTDLVSSSLNFNKSPSQESTVFWHYVREHLTRHELERYHVLKQVWSDAGRGRAWLRSSLNERSLERYLHSLLASPQHLSVFYEDWAFLLDQERSTTLPNMAAGLGSILFAISIDNPNLNQDAQNSDGEPLPCPEPVIPASQGLEPSSKHRTGEHKRRRRVQPQIISFGDEESSGALGKRSITHGCPSSSSSPQGSPPMGSDTTKEATQMRSPCDNRTSSNASQRIESQDLERSRPRNLPLSPPEAPSSINTALSHMVDGSLRIDTRAAASVKPNAQTLTPVNNMSVGELIPVTLTAADADAYSEEDSLSVPSYSEDTDCAAAALLATQRLLQTNCMDFSPQERSTATSRGLSDPSSLSISGEMREALLTLLTLKEELHAETRSLRKLLEQAEERNSHLQAELVAAGRQHAEKAERLEARVQSLSRENELLKHQLRKYVGAVQMLKRDGLQAHEALANLEASQPKVGEPKYTDYHHEAREYEKKLIQVAEMHGELMEFNDRLHRLLQLKDGQLRRLREELVDLRGPLPDDAATSDDDISVTSDYDASSLGAAARALVNIWIPSAFLTGGSSDVHHVYQVFIRIRDDEWNIYRRYAQFYSLHKELKKQDQVVGTFDFPPKKTIGNKDARFVEERRRRLQHYLRCMVNHLVQTNTELATNPDKELLVGLVPFFGETTFVEDKSRRKRASSRNPFTRLRPPDGAQSSEPSPQYQGL